MAEVLTSLDPVIERFKVETMQDPPTDLAARGVSERAIQDFATDCLIMLTNGKIDPGLIHQVLFFSAFHMGMLTQEYLVEEKEKADEKEDRERREQWLDDFVARTVARCREQGVPEEQIEKFLANHEEQKRRVQILQERKET